MKSNKLIIICGPTGIGKTNLSIELAKKLNCEIISVDSRQFYREMSIGTCPPDNNQLEAVKHHFIQNISIKSNYSAGQYQKDAQKKINHLFKNQNKIIAVGGSGMYIDAICNGLDEIPKSDKMIRSKIILDFKENGIKWLRDQMKKIDKKFYDTVDKDNHQRMIRALEVYKISGKPISYFQKKRHINNNFEIVKFGIKTNTESLYKNINDRVDLMINNGLIDEVKKLHEYKNFNALNTVGYKEVFKYLDGFITKQEAINFIKRNSRRYAKRQMTWFRRYNDIKWVEKTDNKKMINFILQSIQCP